MTSVQKRAKQRNYVAKHNYHRAVVMRVKTRYQRQPKHRQQEQENG